jgi:hypothetical protein
MSWRRYSRIVDQLRVEINRASGILDAKLARMTDDLDRLITERQIRGHS